MDPDVRPTGQTAAPRRRTGAWALAAAAGGSVAAIAVQHHVPPDTWWHLAAGRHMALEGAVVRTDPFSHTALGEPWTLPSWLADLGAYLLVDGLGVAALVAAAATVLAAALAVLTFASPGPAPARAAALLPVVVTATNRGHTRPEVFTILGAAVVLLLISRVQSGRSSPWWFVPVAVVWANLHAGFVVGFLLIGSELVGDVVTGDDRWRAVLRWAMPIVVAAVAVAVVNPYGPRLWLYPLETMQLESLRLLVPEWQPLVGRRVGPPALIAMTLLSLLLVGAAAGLARRTPTVAEMLRLLVFGWLAWMALRNVVLFCAVAAPVTARLSALASDRMLLSGRESPVLLRRVGRGLLLAVAAGAVVAVTVTTRPASVRASVAETAPVAAAEVARGHQPVVNTYAFGGWLAWVGVAPSIDGRTDLYGDARVLEHVATLRGEPGWEERLREQGACSLLVTPDTTVVPNAREVGWTEIHADEVAVVLTAPWCGS